MHHWKGWTVGCSEKHFLLFSFMRELILVWFNMGNVDPVSKKWFLDHLNILEAISSLLMVRKSFFWDWILITHIEQHQNHKWK